MSEAIIGQIPIDTNNSLALIYPYFDIISTPTGVSDITVLEITSSIGYIITSAEFMAELNYGGWSDYIAPCHIYPGVGSTKIGAGNTSNYYLEISNNTFIVKYKSSSASTSSGRVSIVWVIYTERSA